MVHRSIQEAGAEGRQGGKAQTVAQDFRGANFEARVRPVSVLVMFVAVMLVLGS